MTRNTHLTSALGPWAQSRRDFLRNAALAGAAGIAAGQLGLRPAFAKPAKIVWGTNADYAQPDMLSPFKTAYGTEVVAEYFSDPSELVTKLRAGGAGVHLMTDGSYHSDITFAEGVLKPIDTSKMPNWDKMIPAFKTAGGLSFEGKPHGIPYAWGTDSIVYNHGALKTEIDDIGALFDPKYKGQIAMPNGLFESLVATALYLGIEKPFAMGEKELDEVTKVLIKQKPLVRSYWNDIGDLKNLMATGEVTICWGWKMLLDIKQYGIDVRWAHPKQGELAWYDAAFLTTDATGEAEEASLAFMDYLIGDTYGAVLGKSIGYLTTSTAAIAAMDPALVKTLGLDDYDSFLAKAAWWTSPTQPDLYQKAWDKVLNA